MKKFLIGSLVGAILVFGWQSVAHMVMSHHDDAYKRMPNDGVVLKALTDNVKDEGQYFLPGMDMNASAEEEQQFNENLKGKPWALITYHPAYDMNMGTSILRGFSTALICVLIFMALLGKNPGTLSTLFLKGLGIGLFSFLLVWYNQNIWMQTPWSAIRGELIDHLVAWGLCGLWLGWWLNRVSKTRNSYANINQ